MPEIPFKESSVQQPVNVLPWRWHKNPVPTRGDYLYIPTWSPTDEELNQEEGRYLLLTPNLPIWDPHTIDYRDQEHAMLDYNGNVKTTKRMRPSHDISSVTQTPKWHRSQFISSVQLLGETVSAVNSVHRKGRVDAARLSQRLNIPYEMAKKTIQATTQLTVRTVNKPSLTRKFSTNDRMLRYPRLATGTFMDTFFSSKKSGHLVRYLPPNLVTHS